MSRRVRLHAEFRRDFRAQLAWLVEVGRDDWAERLMAGVEEVAERILRFPEIGPLQAESRRVVLRKIIFRRLPYVAWYGYRRREPIGDVWLLRLFHIRQDRPKLNPRAWHV